MGYGMDEAWVEEPIRELSVLSDEEKVACEFFQYSHDEWDDLSSTEQREKIYIAKRCSQ